MSRTTISALAEAGPPSIEDFAPEDPFAPGDPSSCKPTGITPGGPPVPRGVRVRRRRQAARLWLPALATFVATLAVGDFNSEAAMRAGVLGVVVISAAKMLSGFPYPTRLIPALAGRPRSAARSAPRSTACVALEIAGASGFAFAIVAPGLLAGAAAAVAVEAIGDMALAARPLRIAVLGGPEFVPAIRRELAAIGGRHEFEVVGWLNVGQRDPDDEDTKAEALRRVRTAITEHEIDLLVRGPGSAAFRSGSNAYELIAAGCLDLPVRMIEGNQLYERTFGHVPIGKIDSAWFLFLMHPSFRASSRISKRAMDIARRPARIGDRRAARRRSERSRSRSVIAGPSSTASTGSVSAAASSRSSSCARWRSDRRPREPAGRPPPTTGSRRSAGSCGDSTSTSCRSWSTCSGAR